MLPDISDARRTVRPEQESEYLSDEIGIGLAPGNITCTFRTSVKTTVQDTSPDFTP